MPGGGHVVTASVVGGQIDLNNEGDVVFNAALDTHFQGNSANDTGLFQWSHGKVSLIARTGTVLPGVGTLQGLVSNVIVTPPPPTTVPNSGAINNDRGQVLFSAELTDGRNVMLLFTPSHSEDGEDAERLGGADREDAARGGNDQKPAKPHPAALKISAAGSVTGRAGSSVERVRAHSWGPQYWFIVRQPAGANTKDLDQLFAQWLL
jgi:hypothetical protein